jgi:hypothetical protein
VVTAAVGVVVDVCGGGVVAVDTSGAVLVSIAVVTGGGEGCVAAVCVR